MESLPCEIALDIFSRLPVTSLMNVKRVCRTWRSFTQHPLLASMHSSRMADDDDLCLLICDLPYQKRLYSLQFSTPDQTNVETMTRIHVPMVTKFHLLGSCNGLLYLQDLLHQDISYLYNPFTRDHIELPTPGEFTNQQGVALGFGFHAMTKEYKVVRVIYYRNNNNEAPQSEVQVLSIGNGSLTWRSKGETCYRILGKPSQVLVNGRLHWLGCWHGHQSQRLLISFDLEDEQFREVPSPDGEIFGRDCSHLVTLQGCLSAVVQSYRSLHIWVMKEYGKNESWTMEFNIGVQLPLSPSELSPDPDQSIYLPHFPLSQARVLCLLKNGNILLEHKHQPLFCFDPKSGVFRKLILQGLPRWFNTFVHIGSLNWIDNPH